MPSLAAWSLIALSALVQMPMVSCNGCGDLSQRMSGTIAAPADEKTFTVLVGRTTFRVPRGSRFADLGGGNYAGYLMHYQTFGGKSLHEYVQQQAASYNRAENSQHGESEFDPAHHRAVLTYDTGGSLRHLEMYQDLGDGGALILEADYHPGGKPSAIAALTPLANDVLPTRPGEPIPQGMGMGNSVLARSTLNDEVANAILEVPLPGYDSAGTFSGLRIEIVNEMSPGPAGDDIEAKCHNGQLAQFDTTDDNKALSAIVVRDILRYREREVAGIPGGETADLQTARDGSFRQVDLTFMTDSSYPPAGQPGITIRGNTNGLQKGNDLRQTLAVWDGVLASATVVKMPAPERGFFGSGPPGYKQLPPCRNHADVALTAAPRQPGR